MRHLRIRLAESAFPGNFRFNLLTASVWLFWRRVSSLNLLLSMAENVVSSLPTSTQTREILSLPVSEILNQILQQAIQNQHTVTHKVVVGHRIKTALFLVLIHGRIRIKEAIQATVMRFQFPIRMRFPRAGRVGSSPSRISSTTFFKTVRAYGARPVAYLGFNGVSA